MDKMCIRDRSIAGRVLVKEGDSYITRLLKIDRDLVLIPNVAIHMNRAVNDGFAYNKQVDLLPLFGGTETKAGDLKALIAKELNVNEEDICGEDLYLYNRMSPSIWGAHEAVSYTHLMFKLNSKKLLIQLNYKQPSKMLKRY